MKRKNKHTDTNTNRRSHKQLYENTQKQMVKKSNIRTQKQTDGYAYERIKLSGHKQAITGQAITAAFKLF